MKNKIVGHVVRQETKYDKDGNVVSIWGQRYAIYDNGVESVATFIDKKDWEENFNHIVVGTDD